MVVTPGVLRRNSDPPPSFVRPKKICTFADVETKCPNPNAGGYLQNLILIYYGKSSMFAGQGSR